MSRVFLSLDETSPLKPVPCLHINGQELRMSETELNALLAECSWIIGHISAARKVYYKSLLHRYRETQNVDAE